MYTVTLKSFLKNDNFFEDCFKWVETLEEAKIILNDMKEVCLNENYSNIVDDFCVINENNEVVA